MKGDFKFRHPKGRNIEVQFRWRPGKWKSTGCADMTAAVEFALREAVKQGSTSDFKRNTTLREYAAGFFTEADPRGFRKRLLRRGISYEPFYFEKHQALLDNYILPAHGDYLINSLTDVMIEDLVIDLESKRRRGEQLANDTKNKVLMCYRIVLQEALRQGYVSHNEAREVQPLPANGGGRGVFTDGELSLLFPCGLAQLSELWGGLRWALYFCILRDTGWRPGEVAALRLSSYYPELHGVFTTSSVDFHTHKVKERIKTTRSGQKFKSGFLNPQTEEILKEYVLSLEGSDPYFFRYVYRSKEQFIYPEVANKHFKSVSRKAGVNLDGRTQYCFRHTFNTRYIGRLPEMARLLLMGHTSNRPEYDHLTPEQNLRRVLQIDGAREALGVGEKNFGNV